MDEEKRPRKPDKRTVKREAFEGFPWQITNKADYSMLPNIWIDVCAAIENLSELKVIMFLMRHTWGFGEFGVFKHLTTDEFINGRKYSDGSRMDCGTGLCERAVINGLALAIEHGWIECEVDEHDKARVKKFYRLKMQPQDEVQDVQSDLHSMHPRGAQSAPLTAQSSERSENELEELTQEETKENRIRIAHPSFFNALIEDFSRDLGDEEHIGSNIRQAQHLYEQSGMDEEAFIAALYAAREKAKRASVKKVNGRGWPNRMPYFFKCLHP